MPAAVDDDVRRLAAGLPSLIRLGTSSWSFAGWRGLVYEAEHSESALARSGLAAYALHPLFRTVGVDRTYYAPVAAPVFAAYAASVASDFQFLVKAHQDVTSPRVRRSRTPRTAPSGQAELNPRFLDSGYTADAVVAPFVAGLGDRAGPLVFQFSLLSAGERGSAPAFIDRPHEFLRRLPRGPRYAVEVRNRELLTPQYRDALLDAGACHCCSIHPSMPPAADQAAFLAGAGFAEVIVRWMLHHRWDYEAAAAHYAPFDRRIDLDERTHSALTLLAVEAVAAGTPVMVIVNNKAEGSAPLTVRELAHRIHEKLVKP